MSRFTPTLAAFCCVVAATASIASAHDLSKGGLTLYERCWQAIGADCGRNSQEDGVLLKDGTTRPQTDAERKAWRDRLHAVVDPPPAPAPVETAAPTSYAAPAPVSSGGCPSYMAAEATSPDAVNPTTGAAGCYQVLPSTAAAMGSACDDVNADSCVAAICASQGNGAWASSGATPC